MSLSFGGADAPSARGSQPRSSDLAELSRSRAGRPAQAKGPPHEQMPESGKTKWHWPLGLGRPLRPPQVRGAAAASLHKFLQLSCQRRQSAAPINLCKALLFR